MTLYYDADCPLCVRLASLVQRLDRQHRISCVAGQTDQLEVRDLSGRSYTGAAAVYRIMESLPVLKNFTWIYRFDAGKRVSEGLYRFVSKRRCLFCGEKRYPRRP